MYRYPSALKYHVRTHYTIFLYQQLLSTPLETQPRTVCLQQYILLLSKFKGTTQGLLCSKSCLSKKNLTIPRLELVAGHMAVNLGTNIEAAIGVEKVMEVRCWLDSTLALYWINGQGEYCQFVPNQVRKIQEQERVRLYHQLISKVMVEISSATVAKWTRLVELQVKVATGNNPKAKPRHHRGIFKSNGTSY